MRSLSSEGKWIYGLAKGGVGSTYESRAIEILWGRRGEFSALLLTFGDGVDVISGE